MASRTPKLVKVWINKVDEAERAWCDANGGHYNKVSNGLKRNGSELVIGAIADRMLRYNHRELLSEFPVEYKMRLWCD